MAGPGASAGIRVVLRGLTRQVIVKLVTVVFSTILPLFVPLCTLLDDAGALGVTVFVAGGLASVAAPGFVAFGAAAGMLVRTFVGACPGPAKVAGFVPCRMAAPGFAPG